MAGRDASTQLGGMLSQIGNTLASRGSAGKGLMSPIRNTFRPDLDPNDPASLQQMARFKERIGEVDQARMFTEQARYQADEQRRVQAEQQAEARLTASQQIARLQTRADEILANPQISDQQKELALQGLQNAINTLGEQGKVDPSSYVGLMNDSYNRNAATRLQSLNLSDAELSAKQQEARMAISRKEADLSVAEPGSMEAAMLAEEIQTLGTEAGLPRQEWADPRGRIARENREQQLALRQSDEAIRELDVKDNLRSIMKLPVGSEERAAAISEFRAKYPGEASERVLELERNYTSRSLQLQEFADKTQPFDFALDEDGKPTGPSPELESMLEGLPTGVQERFRAMAKTQSAAMVRDRIADLQQRQAILQLNNEYSGELRIADQRARLEAGINQLGNTIGSDFNTEGIFGLSFNPFATALNERAKNITDEDRLAMTGLITTEFGANAAFTNKQVAWAFATLLNNEQEPWYRKELDVVDAVVSKLKTDIGAGAATPVPEADDPPSPEYQAAQQELGFK